MKRYNTKFIFYTTKSLKNKLKKRAKDLDISMSDYIRTLIKQDLTLNQISISRFNQELDLQHLNNFNNKLSGYYKDLR